MEGTTKYPNEQPIFFCRKWWESPLSVVGEGVLPLALYVVDVRQVLFLYVARCVALWMVG